MTTRLPLPASHEKRPLIRYCQLRLTKTVRGVLYVTVRWCPESVAVLRKPMGFKMHRSGEWSDAWTFTHDLHPVERHRVHGSWDEWRFT